MLQCNAICINNNIIIHVVNLDVIFYILYFLSQFFLRFFIELNRLKGFDNWFFNSL